MEMGVATIVPYHIRQLCPAYSASRFPLDVVYDLSFNHEYNTYGLWYSYA